MKTSMELEDLMTDIIKTRMAGVISGSVYNDDRPVNSKDEDITVNVLAGRLGQKQLTTINVNIYVPDEWKQKRYVKNRKRLNFLTKIVLELFMNYHKDACKITKKSQRDYAVEDENIKQHFSHIKFLIENINF